jgi:hypothetical protein
MSPSGTDCGLVTYIDRQLAGAWGNGARFYRNGPFLQGKPEHGYQLPLTPREYFAAADSGFRRQRAPQIDCRSRNRFRLGHPEQFGRLRSVRWNDRSFTNVFTTETHGEIGHADRMRRSI